jgi:hypothetical protein
MILGLEKLSQTVKSPEKILAGERSVDPFKNSLRRFAVVVSDINLPVNFIHSSEREMSESVGALVNFLKSLRHIDADEIFYINTSGYLIPLRDKQQHSGVAVNRGFINQIVYEIDHQTIIIPRLAVRCDQDKSQ